MLSKKMAFSLTSLITILALAFVVTPVMAGDFSTAITVGGVGDDVAGALAASGHDVSHEKGEQRTTGAVVAFNVTFGKVVTYSDAAAAANTAASTASGDTFHAEDIILRAYNANGAVLSFPENSVDIEAVNPANGKDYTVFVTLPAVDSTNDNTTTNTTTNTLYVQIPQGTVGAADPTVGDDDDANEKKDVTVTFLTADAADTIPDVLKIARVGEPYAVITSAEFMVHVLLSEDAKTENPAAGGLTKDLIDVGDDATVNSVVKLASPADDADIILIDRATQAAAAAVDANTLDTWRDGMVHLYLVTIGTKPGEKTVTVKVKDFAGMENPMPGSGQEMYITAGDSALVEGRDKLTVKTNTANPAVSLAPGHVVNLKNKRVIPAGGYLIVATATGDTGINLPDAADADDNTPKIDKRTPAEQKYNAISVGIPNLEAFLINGGTIDLVSPDAGLVITEIMWGSDASLATNSNSQWIEIMNTTAADIKTGDKTHKLIFYGPNEVIPAVSTVADRVGTIGAGGYWSIAGKGQNGRTGTGETADTLAAVVPTQSIISMQRAMDVTGTVADGTMASSWAASVPPALNFDPAKGGNRVGSPGAAPVTYPATPVPVPTPTPEPVAPVAMASDIMITEIMVDTGAGRLPQWIELTNMSGKEVSLAGWYLKIENSAADADVVGSTVEIKLSGTLGVGGGEGAGGTMGKSLLLVGGNARSSSNLAGSDRVVDISSDLGQKGRYTLLSPMGFLITLLPPQTTGIIQYGDMAGNLDAATAWEIPMDESGRSSLIRREMDAGMATMGTDANGWILASATPLVSGPATWYGSDEDAGTPGYNAGGPLPVELSHFRPARDKATGQVVITWATQSELNNAGFFIKRSQQRDGEFKVINATMIAGAGTTSEKQFYTFTDTTAQPNVVYYYQIEDVSLDGQRQPLTHGIRLKGHIGAAGKLTSTWGEIKASNE